MSERPLNEYIQRQFPETLSDRERHLIRNSFEAGRRYEASLFSDVINTIVIELRRYRAATKEDNDNDNRNDS